MNSSYIPTTALTLAHTYGSALQEQIEEKSYSDEERLTALHALDSITSLLKGVGRGNPVNARAFQQIINESYAAFEQAGLVSSTGDTSLSIPDWCIRKLYEGMVKLVSDTSELAHA